MSLPRTITHLLPTGAIVMYSGSDIPSGYLLCNGASVNCSDYPDLAEALGETGSTFSLPDYRDRVPQGAGTVSPNVWIEAGAPEMYGSASTRMMTYDGSNWSPQMNMVALNGAVAWCSFVDNEDDTALPVKITDEFGATSRREFYFRASRFSSVYGGSETVQPSAWTAHFLIKS